MIRLAFATAVVLAAGFVVGRLSADDDVAELQSDRSASTVTETVEQPARCASLSPSELESLKHELTAAVMALPDAWASSHTDRVAAQLSQTTESRVRDTAESFEANQRLRETIDTAIATGRWTSEDADVMRELLAVASPAATREVLSAPQPSGRTPR